MFSKTIIVAAGVFIAHALAGQFSINQGHFDCFGKVAYNKDSINNVLVIADGAVIAENNPTLCAKQLGPGWSKESLPYTITGQESHIVIPGQRWQNTNTLHLNWDCVNYLQNSEDFWERCRGVDG